MSGHPFSDLEIFEPELRKKKEFQHYMKIIRGMLIRRSLKAFGVKDIDKLTKAEIDKKIIEISSKEKLFGIWPPLVEAMRKSAFQERELLVKEITTRIKERVEVSPGVFEHKFVQRVTTVVEERTSTPVKKPTGFISERIIETFAFYPSLVIATQTGTGKTDVGALVGLKAILEGRGKVLYLVPLRALAREKERSFRRMWGGIEKIKTKTNIKISKQYMDVEGVGGIRDYSSYDWVIATNEKADSLIRRKHPFMNDLAVLVVDEGDFITEQGRGPTLEVLITRIKRRYPKVQIIFLSATVPTESIRYVSFWLNLRPGIHAKIMNYFINNVDRYFVLTNWRPVKLIYSVYLDGTVYNVQRVGKPPVIGTEKIPKVYSDPILNITLHTIKNGGQVLIFRSTRPKTISTAKKVAAMIKEKRLLKPTEVEALNKIKILRSSKTLLEAELERVLKLGVAFHHAGVPSRILQKIEDLFNEGPELRYGVFIEKAMKVVCATTTLARGMNTPARVVILGDMYRYDRKVDRSIPIPVREFHQLSGRAGRFGKENEGIGYSIVPNREAGEERILDYIRNPGELIESQLVDKVVMRKHILATIALDKIVAGLDLKAFIANTYFARTEELDDDFRREFRETLVWLVENDFALKLSGDRYQITNLGNQTSLFVLDPQSVVTLRAAAEELGNDLESGEGIDELGFLHLISYVEDNGYTRSKRKQLIGEEGWEVPDEVIKAHKRNPEVLIDLYTRKRREKGIWIEDFIIPTMDNLYKSKKYKLYVEAPDSDDEPLEYVYFLRSLFTALVMRDWINEIKEAIITSKYIEVQPGDIFRKHDRIETIASIYGSLDKLPEFAAGIENYCELMFWRLRKGVKAELISLVKVPDIGRTWARKLYDAGYTDRSTLAKKIRDPIHYTKISKLIGKGLAKKLLTRFSKPTILRKFVKEDAALKKGKAIPITAKTLEEVEEEEEARADYYDEVLEIIKQLWAESNHEPIKREDVRLAAVARLGIDPDDLDLIFVQLNRDNLIWFPLGGKVQFIQ